MKHKYSLENIFLNFLSVRGIPYMMFPKVDRMANGGNYNLSHNANMANGGDYELEGNYNLPYGDMYKNGFFMPVTIGGILIPYAVISVQRTKEIVSTSLQGRTGKVKELISINDTEIEITGMIVGSERSYPLHEVGEMNELFNLNQSIDIICPLTDRLLGSETKIVIESIGFPPLKGVEDAQIITMRCITDLPFKLTL